MENKKKEKVGIGLFRILSFNETVECFDEVDDACDLTDREYRIKVVGANAVEFFVYKKGVMIEKRKIARITPIIAGITKEKVSRSKYLAQQYLCDLVGKKLNKDYQKGSLMVLPVS